MDKRLIALLMSINIASRTLYGMEINPGDIPLIDNNLQSVSNQLEGLQAPHEDEHDMHMPKKSKKKDKKHKRAHSFNDLASTQKLNNLVRFSPTTITKSSPISKSEVKAYLTTHLGESEAKEIITKTIGKEKVDSVQPAPSSNPLDEVSDNDKMRHFERLRQNERGRTKKNAIGMPQIIQEERNMNEGQISFNREILKMNSAYAQERITIITTKEAETADKLARNDQILEETRIRSNDENKARVQIAIETTDRWIRFLTMHPYLLVGIMGGISASFFAAKHGMRVLFNEIERIIGIPRLAQETSLLTFREKVAKALGLYKKKSKIENEEVIFDFNFKHQINTLLQAITNTVKVEGYFRNLLFYGEPGTGKTLTAQMIAENSGIEFMYFAASSLSKMSEKDALNQVTELFESAKRSPKKMMIIIDEAEELFAERGNDDLSAQMKKVLTLIMTYTSKESKDYFVVAITNRPQDLDKAMLSRFARKIEFPLPDQQQIKQMLVSCIKKFLLAPQKTELTWYDKLIGKKRKSKRIAIEAGAINAQTVNDIAQQLKGFTGRDILQLVLSFQSEALANNMLLTKDAIYNLVRQAIAEKENVDRKFGF